MLNFRNLSEVQLVFSGGVNLFTGRNGHGKTNVLEALNYATLGRSFRGAPDRELIRFDTEAAHVSVLAEDDAGETITFEFGLDRNGARKIRVDEQPLRRRADLVGKLRAVVFDPQTVDLVRGGPEIRRRFLDQAISSIDADYFQDLQSYTRALKQKNSLLREHRRTGLNVRDDIRLWSREMLQHAAPIIGKRFEFLRESTPLTDEAHGAFTGSTGALELQYQTQVTKAKNSPDIDELYKEIEGVFDYIWESEIKRGRCLAGPHLDDFSVALDGVDLRIFGSRGETRSAAIALKLAQSELVRLRSGTYPILFFDDIFSELDSSRSSRLQEITSPAHQVFIATARDDDIRQWQPEIFAHWVVSEGNLIEQT
jgi:DNA replication and repair protein RecF